jgi:hypothetical protein
MYSCAAYARITNVDELKPKHASDYYVSAKLGKVVAQTSVEEERRKVHKISFRNFLRSIEN